MKTSEKKKTIKKRNIIDIKVEYLFIILGLIFGLFIVFINPPWQSNDEDRHFIHAYYISQGYILPDQGDNKIGAVMPVNIYEVPQRFQGIRFSETNKISPLKLKELENIKLNENNKQFFHNHMYSVNPIGYVPSSIGIFFGQFINDNPVWLGWWGRIGSLLFYIFAIFYAIKLIPIFKNVLFLYALTPMCLYQGASVTYDAPNIALTFLIFAIIIKYAVDENENVGWRELALIFGLMILHRFAKDGYPLIPWAIFLIPPKKFKLPVNVILIYIGFAITAYLIYKLPDWTWSKLLAAQKYHLTSSLALKKDLHLSVPISMDIGFSNPGKMISDIIDNINHFRQEWSGGTIGRFGYSYTLLPNWFFLLHGLIILTVAFLDNGKQYAIRAWQKGLSFAIGVGSILGIIVMSYFYSPIGASQIFGLQGRYLINAVPFLLLIVYNNQVDYKDWKKWGVYILSAYIIIFLILTLIFLDNTFYLNL
jgi:uncharacterized membrane protein